MKKNKLDATQILKDIKKKKSTYWEKVRVQNTLELFKKASDEVEVPAYNKFLKKNNIEYKKINTWDEFKSIPIVDKKNYLLIYPFEDLCWNGNLNKPLVYTSTSGTTGEPFYFVRSEQLDWEYSVIIENYLNLNKIYINKSTLIVNCFGMGVWIGGVMTYKAYEMTANRNEYPVSIITPGISKKDIFNALKSLAPRYESVIIIGYPPFVKDILDEALDYGIELKKLNIRIQFAAEAITEHFRDYIAKKTGMKNLYLDSMNIYGSADIGAMAFESTTSILIRRLAMKNKNLFHDIFSPINKTPTLAQFIPYFINFENINGKIVLTSDSEMPLIRYNIGDNGGVFSFDEVKKKLESHGIDIYKEAKKLGIEYAINELPFVFVYERANLSVSFFGLNIYPEWLRDTLLERKISKYVTGKFTILSKHDKNHNQVLEINIEKKNNATIDRSVKKYINKKIFIAIQKNSSEYRELFDKIGKRANPKVKFKENGDRIYFPSGIKQKWVKN